jgi:RNA-directed DNA polymerase
MVLNGIQDCINLETYNNNDKGKNYNKLIRFADDCILLIQDKTLIPIALKQIGEFLEPRGLKLSLEKTKIIDTRKDPFNFVGFQFKILRKHGKSKIYCYPPPPPAGEAMMKILANLKSVLPTKNIYTFKKGKSRKKPVPTPAMAMTKANSILMGWLNFYRTSNAKKKFSYLKFRIFHMFRRYLFFYMSLSHRFRTKKKKIDQIKLYQNMWQKYLIKRPKRKERWWSVIGKGRKKEKRLFLIHPYDYNIVTPKIIENKSAYLPSERELLYNKSLDWKFGLRGLLYKKHKGLCKCCGIPLGDEPFHLHHKLSIKYGGKFSISNIIPLCLACHQEVTIAERNRDLTKLTDFINNGILSPSLIKIIGL